MLAVIMKCESVMRLCMSVADSYNSDVGRRYRCRHAFTSAVHRITSHPSPQRLTRPHLFRGHSALSALTYHFHRLLMSCIRAQPS